MFIDKETGASFNFVAPKGMAAGIYEYLFPISDKIDPEYASEITLAINQKNTVVNLILTGNVILSAVIHDQLLNEGGMVFIFATAEGSNVEITGGAGVNMDTIKIDSGDSKGMFFCAIGPQIILVTVMKNTGSTTIEDEAVTEAKIADDAVTTAKIEDGAVTLAKLADGVAAGDIMWWNGTSWVILPKGTDGQVLKMVSGSPAWATDAVT